MVGAPPSSGCSPRVKWFSWISRRVGDRGLAGRTAPHPTKHFPFTFLITPLPYTALYLFEWAAFGFSFLATSQNDAVWRQFCLTRKSKPNKGNARYEKKFNRPNSLLRRQPHHRRPGAKFIR